MSVIIAIFLAVNVGDTTNWTNFNDTYPNTILVQYLRIPFSILAVKICVKGHIYKTQTFNYKVITF